MADNIISVSDLKQIRDSMKFDIDEYADILQKLNIFDYVNELLGELDKLCEGDDLFIGNDMDDNDKRKIEVLHKLRPCLFHVSNLKLFACAEMKIDPFPFFNDAIQLYQSLLDAKLVKFSSKHIMLNKYAVCRVSKQIVRLISGNFQKPGTSQMYDLIHKWERYYEKQAELPKGLC